MLSIRLKTTQAGLLTLDTTTQHLHITTQSNTASTQATSTQVRRRRRRRRRRRSRRKRRRRSDGTVVGRELEKKGERAGRRSRTKQC